MRVEFFKHEQKGRRHCRWEAVRGKRTVIPGSFMSVGNNIPHDLAQYVVEAATGCRNGFWGLVAKGATFKSTGRRRTRPGRALIAEHREHLNASEQLATLHLLTWRQGETSPVTAALDRALGQWQQLGPDQCIAFEWPSAVGTVRHI